MPNTPQPITSADRCQIAGSALVAAAGQLRDYAAVTLAGELPEELRRPYDRVGASALYAIAEWLDARAGLYGVTAPEQDRSFG